MAVEKDYTKYSFKVTALVIVLMLGLSFVPPFSICGVRFKRTNILSDLISFPGDSSAGKAFDDSADRLFLDEIERREAELQAVDTITVAQVVEQPAEQTSKQSTGPREQTWNIGSDDTVEIVPPVIQPVLNGEKITPIEDYSSGDGVSISDFCRLLGRETQERLVRIAFLGDSYIEGDIITADVRDQLQSMYGGKGVGFVPFSTPLALHRPTVKQTYGGWTNYSVINKKTAPEELTDKFYMSGTLSLPDSAGAWTLYEMTGYRKHVAQSPSMRLLFENTGTLELKLAINDSIEQIFTPDPSEQVQQIKIGGAAIKRARIEILDTTGFIGYGVVFDSPTGVGVDNYSIRSNSGMALFGTSAKVNSQIGRMLGYDLIVMQYGLNAMSPEVTNYTGYRQNMVRVVNYIKRSFPNAAILLLGVGDRSTMDNGEFVTMDAVYYMIKEQRAIAKECGVAYWDTFTAMGGENSMVDFVEKGWAAKDYTHLSFGGGRYLAKQLVNALLYLKQQVDEQAVAEEADTVVTEQTQWRSDSLPAARSDRDETTRSDSNRYESNQEITPSVSADRSDIKADSSKNRDIDPNLTDDDA